MGAGPGGRSRSGGRSSFIGDLRTVLAGSGFRRLFATRLISQTGDGLFNAGLGAYVFFNATSFPNPAAAATSFAVLYLPYSLIGPFAGVFIDRWSRRQILLWSALLRAGFAALTAVFVVDRRARACRSGSRRSSSSASTGSSCPRCPPRCRTWSRADELVMANSVGPTSGTVVAFIGGIAGIGVGLVTGTGQTGSAVTLLAAALCYLLAGLSATRMSRTSLGPDLGEAHVGSVVTELEGVAAGLLAGLRARLAPAPGPGGADRHERPPIPVRDRAADVDPAVPELLLPGQQRRTRRSSTSCRW